MKRGLIIAGHAVTACGNEDPCAPAVWTHMDAGEAEALYRSLGGSVPGFTLLAVTDADWNRDLSPWPAPRAFRGGEDFAGGAETWLHTLVSTVVPACETALNLTPAWRGVAGYSLAGLFAVYAACRWSGFSRAASMSGSLWFDGFLPWLRENAPGSGLERVYLSVGDRESRSKSPRLQTVADCTDRAAEIFRRQGCLCESRRNPGGHFDNVEQRIRQGVEWICASL